MKNDMTIEIAVRGVFVGECQADHYWRVRWFDDGEEIDHTELMDDLAGMARMASMEGGNVAWRYYETDVFADAGERSRFLESHGQVV